MYGSGKNLQQILGGLYEARNALRKLFPGLSFTLDGKLVGDIGEAIARHDFGLQQLPAGTPRHDFCSRDGRSVQVKTTQATKGASGVGLGLTKQSFEHLLVIQITEDGGYGILFDGPGRYIDAARKHKKSPSLSVNQLERLNSHVADAERLARASDPPLNRRDLRRR